MLNGIISCALIFGVGGLVGAVTGVALGTLVHIVLVIWAKKDPQGKAVYARHIHQQKFYPAAASPFARQQIIH